MVRRAVDGYIYHVGARGGGGDGGTAFPGSSMPAACCEQGSDRMMVRPTEG